MKLCSSVKICGRLLTLCHKWHDVSTPNANKRLAAGLHWDPLGELTALPQTPAAGYWRWPPGRESW